MTGLWKFLVSLVEADAGDKNRKHVEPPIPMGKKGEPTKRGPAKSLDRLRNDLLTYLTRRYGEHTADQIRADMQSSPDLHSFGRKMATDFPADHIMGRSIDDMIKAKAAQDEPKRGPGRPPGSTNRGFVDPSQHASQQAQTAVTAASRPDRAGTQANVPKKDPYTLKPGERSDQPMGNAGQLNPQDQPSLAAQPQTIAKRLDALRQRLAALSKDPKNDAERQKIQGQISDIGKLNHSGVVDAQRRVDYVTKTYGAKSGDAEAAKLGVPTTAERTVKDDQGREQVQVWSMDRLARWKDKDVNPNAPDKRSKDQDEPKAGPHKPMMMAPKGMGNKEKLELAELRSKIKQLMQAGAPPEQLDVLKKQVMRMIGSGEQEMKTVRPGKFVGQRWKPAGMSQKVGTARPDKATGNFAHGSRYTNPAEEGQEVVWDGEDWVLPSVAAAKKAERIGGGD